jgi:hypothetical protein
MNTDIDSLKKKLEKLAEMENQHAERKLKLKKSLIFNTFSYSKLLEHHFQSKDTNIKANLYYFWRRERLIPDNQEKKWVNINFVDFIWLDILNSLKNMSCPLSVLNKVKDELFTKAAAQNLAQKNLQEKRAALLSTHAEQRHIDFIDQILNDEKLMITLNQDISFLYEHIRNCLMDNPIFIKIDEQEQIIIDNNPVCEKASTVLPINSYIKSFVFDEKNKEFLTLTGLFTIEELSFIEQIEQCSFEVIINEDETSAYLIKDDINKVKEVMLYKRYYTIAIKECQKTEKKGQILPKNIDNQPNIIEIIEEINQIM